MTEIGRGDSVAPLCDIQNPSGGVQEAGRLEVAEVSAVLQKSKTTKPHLPPPCVMGEPTQTDTNRPRCGNQPLRAVRVEWGWWWGVGGVGGGGGGGGGGDPASRPEIKMHMRNIILSRKFLGRH